MFEYYKRCFIGFSYGISFPLTLIVLDYWLKDSGVSNAVIGMFTLLHWPFTFKFLWGPFVENYSIPYLSKRFGRIRSWIVFCHLLLIIGVIGMANANPNTSLIYLIISASVVAVADGCKNVVLYPYQVGGIEKKRYGYIAGYVAFGHRIGMILTKVLTLHLAHFFSWKIAYLTEAVLIFIVMISICLMNEPTINKDKKDILSNHADTFLSVKESFYSSLIVPLKNLFRGKDGFKSLSVIILYKGADAMMQKMSRPFCIEVGFTKLEIANIVQLFGSISVLVGCFIGGYFIKKLDIKRAMCIFGVAHAFSFSSYFMLIHYGHNIQVLSVVVFLEAITGGCVTVAFLAFLYNLCKTGSQYALLWAFYEIGSMFFMSISGFIADAFGWIIFFTIIPFIFMPSLIILRSIKERL